LWIIRLADRRIVFSRDRGLDIPADDVVGPVVDFLAAGLAGGLDATSHRTWTAS
jgi:hypothetical protein